MQFPTITSTFLLLAATLMATVIATPIPADGKQLFALHRVPSQLTPPQELPRDRMLASRHAGRGVRRLAAGLDTRLFLIRARVKVAY